MKKKLTLLFTYFLISLSILSAESTQNNYRIESMGLEIIHHQQALYEGSKSKLLFYNLNGQILNETDWMSSNDLIIFKNENIIVLGDTYYPSDYSYTYIFNSEGLLLTEFRNPGITYEFKRISESPFFYLVLYHTSTTWNDVTNRLIIYDLEGNIIEDFYYKKPTVYEFDNTGQIYEILLRQPEVP